MTDPRINRPVSTLEASAGICWWQRLPGCEAGVRTIPRGRGAHQSREAATERSRAGAERINPAHPLTISAVGTCPVSVGGNAAGTPPDFHYRQRRRDCAQYPPSATPTRAQSRRPNEPAWERSASKPRINWPVSTLEASPGSTTGSAAGTCPVSVGGNAHRGAKPLTERFRAGAERINPAHPLTVSAAGTAPDIGW